MLDNLFTSSLGEWAYATAIFAIASIGAIMLLLKHRTHWSKLEKYFTISLATGSGIVSIVLLIMGYPYSSKTFQFNSQLSREYPSVVMYGFILLLILLVLALMFRYVELKKNKSTSQKVLRP